MKLVPWRREVGFPGLRRLDRLFEDFFSGDDFWTLPAAETVGPALDVAETPESVVVKAEVPGIEPKDIDISVTGDTLHIKGEKHEEKEEKGKTWRRVERSFGSFHRSVMLPAPVNGDKVEAEVKEGVLTVTLPKSAEAKRKKIEVKAR